MTSIGDVAVVLRTAVAAAADVARHVQAVEERIGNALAEQHSAPTGTLNSDAQNGLHRLGEVRSRLGEALAALKTGPTARATTP